MINDSIFVGTEFSSRLPLSAGVLARAGTILSHTVLHFAWSSGKLLTAIFTNALHQAFLFLYYRRDPGLFKVYKGDCSLFIGEIHFDTFTSF